MRPWVLGLLVAISLPVLFVSGMRRAATLGAGSWQGPMEDYGYLFAPLLFVAAVVFVIVLFSLDFAKPRPPTGELEHLLGRKQHLFHLAGRVRGSWTPAPCQAVKPAGSVHVSPTPLVPPGNALETLVRLKRRGAWAPRAPGSLGEGPGDTRIRR